MNKKFDVTNVGDYLRTYRRYKELTLAEVSRHTGLSSNSIFNLEAGRNGTLETMWAVCTLYKLNLSTLFEFSEAANTIGILKAYESECPHLLEYRRVKP